LHTEGPVDKTIVVRLSLGPRERGRLQEIAEMRVLHVFPVSDIGGAENVLLNLIRYREQASIEHHAILVTDGEGGSLGAALTQLGVPWRKVPRGRMREPRAVWSACQSVRRITRESQIDVLFANSQQAYLYGRWATFGLGLPVALYYMTVPQPRLWENGWLDVFMACSRPSALFTASARINDIVSGWGLRHVQTVHHGTPVQPVQQGDVLSAQEILSRSGVPANAPVILLPGRLQPWKGQHVLIEALPAILNSCPDAHVVLLGGTLFGMDPGYPDMLRRRIAALSLEQRVHLVGHHPVRGWIERAAVVVHASIEPDPFPNVCIEALAARRPLVTNTESGTSEILTHDVDGMIAQPDDPETLAAAVITLLRDPATAARIAEAGYQRYLVTCTPSHMVRPIEARLMDLSRTPVVARNAA
jgi:glycosyltransferase involved in cell wall biosynthesis